jgi:hypothetical protein
VFDKYYTDTPPKFALFDGFRAQVDSTRAADLYGFIQQHAHEADVAVDPKADPRALPTSYLRETAERIRKKFFRNTKTEEKLKGNVAKYCESAFADEATREQYDGYLEFVRRRRGIDQVTAEIREVHGGKCDRTISEDYVLTLESLIGKRKAAADFFAALCETRGFTYDLGEDESPALQNKMVCRCGAPNDIDKGRGNAQHCSRCGRAMWQHCPVCNIWSPNKNVYCSCGFDFRNIDRAGTHCLLAKNALAIFDLDEASRQLDQAKALYVGHPDIADIVAAFQSIDSQIGDQVSRISRLVDDRALNEAKRAFLTLTAGFPRYSNPGLLDRIDSQLSAAQSKLDAARSLAGKEEVLRACQEVYAMCRDVPGLADLAAQYTDLPLEALALNDASPSGLHLAVINNQVTARLTAPNQGESAVAVVYRFDRFPDGPTDPKAQRQEFPVALLQSEGILQVERVQKRTYFLGVFLKFDTPSGVYHSRGLYQRLNLADKTVLTYSVGKRFFSKVVTLEFNSDQASGYLPEIHLLYNVGNVPVYEHSARLLGVIPAGGVQFPCRFEVAPPNPLARNTFVKPFIHDEADAFQLRLASGATNQIS